MKAIMWAKKILVLYNLKNEILTTKKSCPNFWSNFVVNY